MPKWVETTWVRVKWEEKISTKESPTRKFNDGFWDRTFIVNDNTSFEVALNYVTDYCNEKQYEIKAIVPIDRAETHTYAQSSAHTFTHQSWAWGLGYGYGYIK